MTPTPQEPTESPTAFKRRGRIVFYLLAVLVFVGLAPLAIVSWRLITVNRELLTTAQQEYQLLLASSIANELDSHVEGVRAEISGVGQTLAAALDRDGRVREPEVRAVLSGVAVPPLLYLRYSYSGDRGGKSISAGAMLEEFEAGFAEHLGDSLVTLARLPKEAQIQAVVSEPIFGSDPARGGLLAVSAPVLVDGRFRGVLTGLVDLQSIWHSVTGRTLTGHVLYALDSSGQVFATSDPERVATGSEVGDSELVKGFLSAEGRSRMTMPYTRSVSGEERPFLGSYASTGQQWGVFVRAPQRSVYAPVREMIESSLTWSLGALLLACLAAIFFANTLSGPINRLAAASHAFAAGDFSMRVETGSRTELGELAASFNTMADDLEGHIQRLRRAAEQNNELFMGMIAAMAQAIDAKDRYTRGHSVRVNRYSVVLARELGLSDQEVRDIHVASLLHDVGKIGIHDSVLNKPGKLTDEEFALMKKHTIFGAAIVAPIPQMKTIIPGLRWHHERWAGGGYPDGLQGEQIPLMARIIAVADTFDAVTTARPYQKTMTVQEALQTVNRLKGVSLDDRVVEAFFRAFRAGKIRVDSRDAVPQNTRDLEPVRAS